MKQLCLLVAFFVFTSILYSQSLFTYGTHAVSKDDFLRAYNKNKTTVENKDQALKDYLDLYIKFKLKVQAAKDMRLDTLPSLEADLDNFKGQIEDSYLKDEKQVSILTDEAEGNIRDVATIEQLVVLSNMESINAVLIHQGLQQSERLQQLNNIAITQMKSLISKR